MPLYVQVSLLCGPAVCGTLVPPKSTTSARWASYAMAAWPRSGRVWTVATLDQLLAVTSNSQVSFSAVEPLNPPARTTLFRALSNAMPWPRRGWGLFVALMLAGVMSLQVAFTADQRQVSCLSPVPAKPPNSSRSPFASRTMAESLRADGEEAPLGSLLSSTS